jgi:hypothetical protein
MLQSVLSEKNSSKILKHTHPPFSFCQTSNYYEFYGSIGLVDEIIVVRSHTSIEKLQNYRSSEYYRSSETGLAS